MCTNNFSRLVICHLNMRNLINKKNTTSSQEISHHSRIYCQLVHILLQKMFFLCWGKVLLLDLYSLNSRRLILLRPARSLLNSLTPLGLPGGSVVKNPPVTQKTWVRPLSWKDPLEKGMATHSSILAWRIPWTEEPGRLQSSGLQSRMQLSTHTHYPLYSQIIMVNMVFFWSECHIFNRACKNNDSTTTTKVNMAHQNQDCTFSPLCASSSAYLIGLQILEISNSGKSGPENFSKHKPYHIWMPTMWKALCWVYF